MTRAEDTRERILFAAEEVVLRDGVAHLTLDAAAAEAGVSKGGILYHFGSRAALVAAMVRRLYTLFAADLDREGGSSGSPGSFTRAYLEATFGPPVDASASRERRLGAAVIAGVASDTELLEPLRESFALWQQSLANDAISPATATLIRLAADGLWFTELLGLAPLDQDLRSAVHDGLVALLDSSLASPPASGAQPRAAEHHTGRSRRKKNPA